MVFLSLMHSVGWGKRAVPAVAHVRRWWVRFLFLIHTKSVYKLKRSSTSNIRDFGLCGTGVCPVSGASPWVHQRGWGWCRHANTEQVVYQAGAHKKALAGEARAGRVWMDSEKSRYCLVLPVLCLVKQGAAMTWCYGCILFSAANRPGCAQSPWWRGAGLAAPNARRRAWRGSPKRCVGLHHK